MSDVMQHADSLNDQSIAMKVVFYQNKLSNHQRAQLCAFFAYHIAELLEDEELLQRSGFVILHFTCMLRDTDMVVERSRHYRLFRASNERLLCDFARLKNKPIGLIQLSIRSGPSSRK